MEHGFSQENESPDMLIIEKEEDRKSIGIAQARQIKDFMRERPYRKKVKAILVEDAQLLTDDAQNSLLKILEEPPVFGLIILLTDKEGSLLPTVVSRCQKILLNRQQNKGESENTYDIQMLSYEEIFNLAKDLSADKETALEFLENVLHWEITENSVKPDTEVTTKTEKFIKDVSEANVAMKFALEYIFLLRKIRV